MNRRDGGIIVGHGHNRISGGQEDQANIDDQLGDVQKAPGYVPVFAAPDVVQLHQ